jgi:hypothetical protein
VANGLANVSLAAVSGISSAGTIIYSNRYLYAAGLTNLGNVSFSLTTNSATVQINSSPLFVTSRGNLLYGSLGKYLITRGIDYYAFASSNFVNILGYSFSQTGLYDGLSTNNFVATYGTIASNVLAVIGSNTTNGYTTNAITASNAPGSSAFAGGVLLPDGRVFCVPRSSTNVILATSASTNKFPIQVLLGPTYNKF